MYRILNTWLSPALLDSFTHETPFFVFSRARLIERLNEFKTYFPHSSIFYAMKANSEPEVLTILRDHGSSFEVASIHELDLLHEIGVPPDRIIFGTAVKPARHVKAAFAYGVDRFAFDSQAELHKIAAEAPGSRVFVRVTVEEQGSRFTFSEKFSTSIETAVPLLRAAQALGLVPYGMSFHVGSQASNPHAWANALTRLAPAIESLTHLGTTLDAINIGGGFPCRYILSEGVPSLPDIATSIHDTCRQLGLRQRLILEPGRGVVAQAGCLVASVIARHERNGRTWLYLDAGVYNGLYETLAFQGSTQYHVTVVRQ